MSKITLIWAAALGGVIGNKGALPWTLRADMARFKTLTMGGTVIMGRKTWDSLPGPLKGRNNLIVTRSPGLINANCPPNVAACGSMAAALHLARSVGRPIWVIGGAEIYQQALPFADAIEVTEINRVYPGDTKAPVLGTEWQEVSRESHDRLGDDPSYSFVRYERYRRPEPAKNLLGHVRAALTLKNILPVLACHALAQLVFWTPVLTLRAELLPLEVASMLVVGLMFLGALSVAEALVRFGVSIRQHFRIRSALNHKE